MIFRYPVIIALTVAMAAVPAAQGRLGGSNTINDDTHHKPITAQVELQMDTAEQELHEVDAVSNFEAGVQLEELDALAEQEETPDEAESNIFDLEAIVRQKVRSLLISGRQGHIIGWKSNGCRSCYPSWKVHSIQRWNG